MSCRCHEQLREDIIQHIENSWNLDRDDKIINLKLQPTDTFFYEVTIYNPRLQECFNVFYPARFKNCLFCGQEIGEFDETKDLSDYEMEKNLKTDYREKPGILKRLFSKK